MTQRLTPERYAILRGAITAARRTGELFETGPLTGTQQVVADLLDEIDALRAELAGAEERGRTRLPLRIDLSNADLRDSCSLIGPIAKLAFKSMVVMNARFVCEAGEVRVYPLHPEAGAIVEGNVMTVRDGPPAAILVRPGTAPPDAGESGP